MEARGLLHGSRAELIQVLLAVGVSTRETATATSGRGVGLAALRGATTALGGDIEVVSEAGGETSLIFRVSEHLDVPGSLRDGATADRGHRMKNSSRPALRFSAVPP